MSHNETLPKENIMTLNGIDIAKKAVGLVVGAGASKIVHAIIQNNISPEKVIDKITIVSASVVIGSMAREATKEYTDGYARIWEEIYRDVPEINTYFVVVAPGLDRPNPVNFGISFLALKNWSERSRSTQAITAELGPKMFARIAGVISG